MRSSGKNPPVTLTQPLAHKAEVRPDCPSAPLSHLVADFGPLPSPLSVKSSSSKSPQVLSLPGSSYPVVTISLALVRGPSRPAVAKAHSQVLGAGPRRQDSLDLGLSLGSFITLPR